jgi:hypothetical protein
MKNVTKISFLLLLVATTLASCSQKTSGTKTVYTTVTNPSTGTDTGTGTGTGTVTGCSDGVARSGTTSCYYSNLPRLVISGPGTYGTTIWSSKNNLPSSISQNQFRTDATFAVRIKPTYPLANEPSRQGRTCSGYTSTNFTKLKVWVMLRRSIDSLGEVQELTASVNSYSNTARFTVPGGTSDPYIVEVIGVNSDHRCNTVYGSLSTSDRAACTAGTKYYDIPVNSTTAPTECVAFKMDIATDDTYDLPN